MIEKRQYSPLLMKLFDYWILAYVCGEREGLILETHLKLGDSLNGIHGLNIHTEEEIIHNKLQQLYNDGASEKKITMEMKDLGIERLVKFHLWLTKTKLNFFKTWFFFYFYFYFDRARKYGWPNTYSFTKAMGEMLLGHLKNNIPIVIIRPSIITSTFREPFSGWLEGVR